MSSESNPWPVARYLLNPVRVREQRMKKVASMTLELAEAEWRLARFPPEYLPDVACAALEAGLDSESLCVLAGLVRPTGQDAGPVFEQALEELGRPPVAREQAIRLVATHWVRSIVAGAVRPIEGAGELALFYPCKELPELDAFWLLAEQWECIEQCPSLEREIIDTAQRLLARLET